jgi:hypothetical protein
LDKAEILEEIRSTWMPECLSGKDDGALFDEWVSTEKGKNRHDDREEVIREALRGFLQKHDFEITDE